MSVNDILLDRSNDKTVILAFRGGLDIYWNQSDAMIYMWERINSPQDLWGSVFPGPKTWTKESIYTSPLMTQLKGRNLNESAFSASTLLTISCSSFKTSTLQFFAFSTKASLKSLKRTRQESFGVLPFSLFSNKDAAFSSRSQITREISATNAAQHTDEVKNH